MLKTVLQGNYEYIEVILINDNFFDLGLPTCMIEMIGKFGFTEKGIKKNAFNG